MPVGSPGSRSIPTPDARSQSSMMSSMRVIWQKSNTLCPFLRSSGSSFARSCILPLDVLSSIAGRGSSSNIGGVAAAESRRAAESAAAAGSTTSVPRALVSFSFAIFSRYSLRLSVVSRASFFANPDLRAALNASCSAAGYRNGWLHTF